MTPLLLHVNPLKTLKNVHTKQPTAHMHFFAQSDILICTPRLLQKQTTGTNQSFLKLNIKWNSTSIQYLLLRQEQNLIKNCAVS